MAPLSKPENRGQPSAVPSFDQSALAKLRVKISQELETANAKKANGGKRKRGVETADDSANHKVSKKQSTKPPRKQESSRESKAKVPAANGNKKSSAKSDAILEEIKALGGDEADLELVAGVDSDMEGDGSNDDTTTGGADAPVTVSFANELAKFAAGLGFDQVQPDEVQEDEEDEEDEDQEDEEQEDEEEEEEEEEEDDDDDDDDNDDDDKSDEEIDENPGKQQQTANSTKEKKTKEAEKPETDPLLFKDPKFAKLAFEPRADWHAANLSSLPTPKSDDVGRLSSTIASLYSYSNTLLETDAAMYRDIASSSSSHRFMSTIMSSGTMSDKVSALTLEVQETPVHNMKPFENLMGLAGKRSRGPAIAALGALVDLLSNGVILPSDRRLRTFHSQPALLGALQAAGSSALAWRPGQPLPGKITKAHLIMWKYEDWLKDNFFKMLQLLEVWINDEIEYSRVRSVDFVYNLLRNKPEQEANLLRLLVNKLGDRERKIASRTSYLLLQLLNQHPGMKPIVIETIEQEILLRPGQSLRARYYAINTLQQTILSSKEPAIADALVRIYFELFLALLKSGALGAVDFPGATVVAEGEAQQKQKRRDPRAEEKREQKRAASQNSGNERDVAEKLVSALLTGVNRAIPFANTDNATLETHIDTLFRITHSSNFNTSIQALVLIQQVASTKQLTVERFYRTLYESLLDPRLATSSKQAMYLNLLFRALKSDVDVRRVKAFVKRMLQIATLHQPSFICGILFLIVELEKTFPNLKMMINDPEMNDDDEEEVYRDVVEGDAPEKEDEATKPAKLALAYDGRKRDPEYNNAHLSCLWELAPYLHHYHPSVMAFAANLLERQVSLSKPDMANHTLMHFLDKFVYRNPKAASTSSSTAESSVKQRGASIMQPAATNNAAQIVGPGKANAQTQQINSAAFWEQDAANVAAEDAFFHAYFTQIGKPAQSSRAAKRAAKQKEASALAGDDEDSDADEEEIWQALKASRPEVDADADGADMDDMDLDDDEDLSGLESLLNDSEDEDEDEDDMDGMDGMDDAGMDVDMDEGDGGVDFADFSDEEAEDDKAPKKKMSAADVLEGVKKGNRFRRKEFKALPMFASADDYLEMLQAEEDEYYR